VGTGRPRRLSCEARAGPEANGEGAGGSGPQREYEPKSKRLVRPSSRPPFRGARRAARDLGAQVAGRQRPVMASCLLAFGSVVRSGGGSQGERVGQACARACGMAHGRPRHCDPDRPRHQRQRPNASADRPHRGPRGRGRGLRGHLRGTARHAGARVPRSRHDPGGGPGGHRLAPARAACRRRPGSDRQPVRIGRLPR
jgi:hypothetical protein